ncbi:WD40 repeat-like protein [Wallemia mellicola]|uniref:WD40 repeat-like protein n=1 Tax=Wallemia mellicola TaxID=1708541 RepID=A0A4T0Q279_9BASI|nr:WD40 repeat-like protein [Wallemia mellicola]TIC07157.1 WD40 repeat-like protein [Wallemia mellicola]TIC17098.1 WD40 repeat-like protein [Wallemia mellicola]
MSISLKDTHPINPYSERGSATKLAVDAKGEKLVYANGRSVIIRDLKNPSKSFVYQGHIQPVTVARISPSGFYCASGDVTGTVRVWDIVGEDKVLKSEVKVTSGRINDLDWDGDSQRIIAIGEGRDSFGRAFMMDSGTNCGEITGHSKRQPGNAVAVRNKRPFRAVTASDDSTLVFYHGTPYKFVKTIKKHTKFVQDVRFSPDDSKFVSVGSDGSLFVFDASSGDIIHESLKAHSGSIYGVAWASDSSKFVTTSADRYVKVWCANTYNELLSYEIGQGIDNQQVGVVWPANSEKVISLGVNGTLNEIDVSNKDSITKGEIHGATRAITAFAQTESSLISGSFDGNLRSFTKEGGECKPIEGGSGKSVTKLFTKGISKDIGALTVGFDDKLRAVDTALSNTTTLSVPLSAFAKGLAADENYALVTCINDTIDIVEYKQGGEAPKKSTTVKYTPSAITLDKDLVAVGDETGKVHLLEFTNGVLGKETKTLERGRSEITAISFSPSGEFIAVGENNGKITVYDRAGEVKTSSWAFHTARITSIEWTADSQVAMTTSLDTNIYFYSIEKPSRNISIKNVAAGGLIGGVWTSDAKSIAVAGADGNIRTYDVDLKDLK